GAKGNFAPGDSLFNIEKGQVSLTTRRNRRSPFKMAFSGGLRPSRQDQTRELFGVARIPATRCQALIDTPPASFAPDIQEIRLKGSFQAAMEFNVPLQRPQDFFYRFLDHNFACEVEAVPHAFSAEYLNGA